MPPREPTVNQKTFFIENGLPVPPTYEEAKDLIVLFKEGVPCFPDFTVKDWVEIYSSVLSAWHREQSLVPSRMARSVRWGVVTKLLPLRRWEIREIRKAGRKVGLPFKAEVELVTGPSHLIGRVVTLPFNMLSTSIN